MKFSLTSCESSNQIYFFTKKFYTNEYELINNTLKGYIIKGRD